MQLSWSNVCIKYLVQGLAIRYLGANNSLLAFSKQLTWNKLWRPTVASMLVVQGSQLACFSYLTVNDLYFWGLRDTKHSHRHNSKKL